MFGKTVWGKRILIAVVVLMMGLGLALPAHAAVFIEDRVIAADEVSAVKTVDKPPTQIVEPVSSAIRAEITVVGRVRAFPSARKAPCQMPPAKLRLSLFIIAPKMRSSPIVQL